MKRFYFTFCDKEDCFLSWLFESETDNHILTFVAMLVCVFFDLWPWYSLVALAALYSLPYVWWDLRTPKW